MSLNMLRALRFKSNHGFGSFISSIKHCVEHFAIKFENFSKEISCCANTFFS